MSDGWIGYDPGRVAALDRRVREVIDDLATIRSDDAAAAGALGDVGLARLHLETGWLPVLGEIMASTAMVTPIDTMSDDELLAFLCDDDVGQLVFGLIDVANEGDLGEWDGNWSTDDVAAATDPAVVRRLLEQAEGIDAGAVDGLVATVTAVATRLEATDEAWEDIDDDVGWYEDGVVGTLTGLAGDVWDRASTYGQYLYQAGSRMVQDPGQSVWDIGTGTFFVEQVAAAEAILIEDGELYNEGPFCGDEGECIVGARPLPGAAATTFGHTVVFAGSGVPEDALIEHEFQHVADIEDVGAGAFYSSYVANYMWNAAGEVDDVIGGQSLVDAHGDAYEAIVWEQRADAVERDVERRDPRGIFDQQLDEWFDRGED